MNLLALDTSTEFCSVALDGGGRRFSRHVLAGNTHSEIALGLIDGLLAEAGLRIADLSGIAFGEGPGSFTGLRIGAGIVQGLALSRDLPVAGICTLEALAEEARRLHGCNRVIACLDARMSEVYHAAYVHEGGAWRVESAPGVFPPASVPAVGGTGWAGAGSGFAACGDALGALYGAQLARVLPDVWPVAGAILDLARPLFERGGAGDAATAVPIYLRDKVALKSSERA